MKRELAGMAVGVLAAALLCAAAPEAQAGKKKKFAKDEGAQVFQGMVKDAPDGGDKVSAFMEKAGLDSKTVAERRLAGVTPANVQQYAAGPKGKSRASLGAVAGAAADAIEQAGHEVEASREEAVDEPQQYTAEKGAELISEMAALYNDATKEIKERVWGIRSRLSEMVAIALVINANSGGAGGPQAQSAQVAQDAAARNTLIIPGDAAIGRAIMAQAQPEIPLSLRGKQDFEESAKLVAEITPYIKAQGKKLAAISARIAELQAKEGEYNRGMKGDGGAQGTGAVLTGVEEAIGQYFVAVTAIASDMDAFVKGRGRTIYDVVECAQALYDAGYAQTVENTEARRLALAREALDSNQKAARGVGPMAGEWYGKLALLEMKGLRMAHPPGYESMAAPEAGESQSPDSEDAERFMYEESEKVED